MTNTAKNMGKLQVTTPSEREIAMTRVFDAPRSLVFDAWTKPELLKRWLGVRGGWTFAVCEVDLRVGGSYRFVWRGPTGAEMGMGGSIERSSGPSGSSPPRSSTSPGTKATRWTRRPSSSGGKTTATTTVRYASQEVRDAVLKTPMLTGVAESYDKMAEVLASRVGQGVQ